MEARSPVSPRPLGIGFTYLPSLPAELYRSGALLDYVEVVPEGLCRERRVSGRRAIDLDLEKLERAQATCGDLPVVVHGVELSIGSAHGWNDAYLEMLDQFQQRWPFVWHSEHLSFQTIVDERGSVVEVGVPLPLPFTEEAVALVAERARILDQRYGVPFLLENATYYLPELPRGLDCPDEASFVGQIQERSGCGHLLDLFNLYCNAVNLDFDAGAMLRRYRLDRVIEVHVAGGSWCEGFAMDSHSERVPEVVWDLLETTLREAPHVGGVTFEILEETGSHLGPEVIAGELERARAVWRRVRREGAR